jgi:hypothetical protein
MQCIISELTNRDVVFFNGTIARDFYTQVFFMDLLYMGPAFEAKRISTFVAYSRSYFNSTILSKYICTVDVDEPFLKKKQ